MSRRRLNKISSKAAWSSFQSALHPKGEQRGELASSTRQRRPVLVGSDCSGLSTELLALEYAGIPFKSAFASECAVGVRVIHDFLHGPRDRFFHDAGDSHTKREHVDLYVAGPPCQPFSTQGVGLGFADPRGATMRHVLRYIGRGRPKVVVIENVKGLVDRHTECLDYVLQALTREGYSVTWNIMRTDEHGVPHSRSRLYVVAMLEVVHRFEWPQILKVKHKVERFLDSRGQEANKDPLSTQTARRSWRAATAKLQKRGVDYTKTCCFVDVRAAVSYANINIEKLPCLTAARGAQGGFHISTKHRMTTIHELGRLQGWHTLSIDKVLGKGAKVSALGRALGSGMSVNILYRLLPRALWSAGLLERKPRDVFKIPPAEARALHGYFPDALYEFQGSLT